MYKNGWRDLIGEKGVEIEGVSVRNGERGLIKEKIIVGGVENWVAKRWLFFLFKYYLMVFYCFCIWKNVK